MRYWFMGYGGMWLFPILGIILVILIIAAVSRRMRWHDMEYGPNRRQGWTHGDQKDAESALDILNKRYAKGEIQKEEYERMKKDILG